MLMESVNTIHHCIGCGAAVPDVDGPVHAYIGASPGCWSVYCDVLGREYGEMRNPPWHRMTVDAYAAEHPGTPSRRSIQSVAVHLIALHLLLDEHREPRYVTKRLGPAVASAQKFHWLEPPCFDGAMTVLDVAATSGERAHEQAVRAWAADVWRAWGAHHAVVRAWAAGLG